ncbi:MAG: nucleoside 2-deoxyribosyltransferase [Gemmatimonadaceae bacterium]|nr:nucleoside 2-deoxyribosyltransferase [Gemmatimonadaceae bacterium]
MSREPAIIYFAGSISGGRGDRALYVEIISALRSYGRVLTEHIADENLTDRGETLGDVEIHDRDIEWLRSATCMVAEVTTPSLGVGYEIGRAAEWKLPILCLFRTGNGRRLSAMIAGCGGVRLQVYADTSDLPRIFDSFFLA